MKDPQTVAFDIYIGRKKKKNGSYRTPLITIWHVDPCKDGTDDSCGWFMRERHGNPETLEKIIKEFEFNFDSSFKSESSDVIYYTGFFSPNTGMPQMSVHGIVLNMYSKAAWIYFNGNRKKHKRFMNKNLFDILHFAENPVDSLYTKITGMFRIGCGEPWKRDEALKEYASIVYADIMRKERKWYQHPKWHIKHWKIQFHPLQQLKRRYWDKCCECGKRGFKGAAMSNWDGTKRWHMECDKSKKHL